MLRGVALAGIGAPMPLRPIHLAAAILAALLAPIAINTNLRWTYEQTLAHWLSKVRAPDRVIAGDSLVAGGGDFGHFGTINLGITGELAAQLEGKVRIAQAYQPRHIIILAGYNDILLGYDDPAILAAHWRAVLRNSHVAVILPPHTRFAAFNAKIDRYNKLLAGLAAEAGRAVIVIPNITGADGLRLPGMAAPDGTHFTRAAYAEAERAIDRALP